MSSRIEIIDGCDCNNVSNDILRSEKPLLLKGLVNSWPLVQAAKKAPEDAAKYLEAHYSGKPVRVSLLPAKEKGRVFYGEGMQGFNFTNHEISFPQVVEKIFSQEAEVQPEGVYMASSGVDIFFPSMLEELSFSENVPRSLVNIWLGNQSRIAAHYDFAQNLACCVAGKRRFTLFPPEQGKNLYVGPLDRAPGGQEISTVDFANPDFEKYPKFRQALEAAQVAELEAGDALIIPSMWWHHVEGLTNFNVLITHWWRTSPPYLGRPTNALLLAIMSLRDLPLKQRDAWRALFDYYVFDHERENFEHIPPEVRNFLESPLDELTARKLRADLQNKMRR